MSQPILLKVYGHIWPAPSGLAPELCRIGRACLPGSEPVSQAGDLVNISFEGLYFPVDDFVAAIRSSTCGREQGKLDVLDLENWQLTRWLIENGALSEHRAPLNNVLAWSGH